MGATRPQRTGPSQGAWHGGVRCLKPLSAVQEQGKRLRSCPREIDGSSFHEAQPKHVWRSVRRLVPRDAVAKRKGQSIMPCVDGSSSPPCSRVHARLQNAKMKPAKQNKTKQNKTKNTKHNTNKTKWELGMVESKEKRNPVSIFSHFSVIRSGLGTEQGRAVRGCGRATRAAPALHNVCACL